MMNPRSSRTAGFIAVLACASAVAPGLSSAAQAPTGGEQAPRPVASVPKPVANETQGRIRLDAVVTDAAGKPASGLTRQDFKLLDNDRPTTIASFQASDGAQDPPIAVILVIDLVNSTADDVISARTPAEQVSAPEQRATREPPSSSWPSRPDGLQMQSQPSTDGNTLASFVGSAQAGAPRRLQGSLLQYQTSSASRLKH